MPRKNLTESGAHTQILEANSDGSFLVQVISPGWGSSGYYSSEVLEAAGKAKVWPAGCHMYFDHPDASEAEYVELGLAEQRDPQQIGAALDAVLPDGLDVVTAIDAGNSTAGSLADLLTASHWRIDLGATPREVVAAAVAAFLAEPSVPVERMTKKGLRTFDCRAAVVRLDIAPDGQLDLLLEHTVPAVRPDDVLTGLRDVAAFDAPPTMLLTRLEQGVLDRSAGTVGDPLAAR